MNLCIKSWHIEAETCGCHFAEDVFKCIFLNENVWSLIKFLLKFVPKGPINNSSIGSDNGLVLPGDKPL